MTARQIEGEFETVVEVLRAAALANADVEAYVEPAVGMSPRRALTFSQWDRAADGVAGLFADRGVTRGTVVCLMLPSCIDYMVAYAAATRLGAITSGINPRLGSNEVRSILERTRPVVTVIDDRTNLPDGRAGTVMHRAEVVGAFDGKSSQGMAGIGADRSGGRGVDQRDHRAPEGGCLRPSSLGRGGGRHRHPVGAGRPPALPTAVRPRRIDDPHLGRGCPWRDNGDHPHPLEGGLGHLGDGR